MFDDLFEDSDRESFQRRRSILDEEEELDDEDDCNEYDLDWQ